MTNRVETGHLLAEIEIDRAGYATAHGVGSYEQWSERAKQSLANSIVSSITTRDGRLDYVARVTAAYDSQTHMHGRRGGEQSVPTINSSGEHVKRLEAQIAERDREITNLRTLLQQVDRDTARDRERMLAWVKPRSAYAVGMKEGIPDATLAELGREVMLRVVGRFGGTSVQFTDLDDETALAIRTIIWSAETLREDLKLPKQSNPKQQPPTIANRAVRKLDLD